MEKNTQISINNQQLYHIFVTKRFTFCLVCKTEITKQNYSSKNGHVTNHLNNIVHQENLRSLFKMCISDPSCDSSLKDFSDVITKSVFDISLLLGTETSYISRKGKYHVCLMCQNQISKVDISKEKLKKRTVRHLESETHLTAVKEVCWVYRLNSDKDFILFHKSVVYCSLCKDTYQCKEDVLLQTLVNHLKTNHPNQLQNSDLCLNQVGSIIKDKVFELENPKSSGCHIYFYNEEELKLIQTEEKMPRGLKGLNDESLSNKSEDLIFVSQDSKKDVFFMFQDYKDDGGGRVIYPLIEEDSKVCFIQDSDVTLLNPTPTSIECEVPSLLNNENCDQSDSEVNTMESVKKVIDDNSQFMQIQSNNSYCNLCWRYISFSQNHNALMWNFFCHFQGATHKKARFWPNKRSNKAKKKINLQKIRILTNQMTGKHELYLAKKVPKKQKKAMKRAKDLIKTKNKPNQSQILKEEPNLTSMCGYNNLSSPDHFMINHPDSETLGSMKLGTKCDSQSVVTPKKRFYCNICSKHIPFSPNEKTLTGNYVLHFEEKNHLNVEGKMLKQALRHLKLIRYTPKVKKQKK